jgi:5'-methylthioadenosine phosphorylase
MTQYPESVLAKEQQMCYLNISVITDYDAGLEGNSKVKPVTSEEVVKRFTENKENVKSLLREIIKNMPEKRSCDCDSSMANAEI